MVRRRHHPGDQIRVAVEDREVNDCLLGFAEREHPCEKARNWVGSGVWISRQHTMSQRFNLVGGPCEERPEPLADVAHLPTATICRVAEPSAVARSALLLHRAEQFVGHPPVRADRLQPILVLVTGHRLMRSGKPAVVRARSPTAPAHRLTDPVEVPTL